MKRITNNDFHAIVARRRSNIKGVMLSRILKSGNPGKPFFVSFLWNEKGAQDVITRLESMNPGQPYVEVKEA